VVDPWLHAFERDDLTRTRVALIGQMARNGWLRAAAVTRRRRVATCRHPLLASTPLHSASAALFPGEKSHVCAFHQRSGSRCLSVGTDAAVTRVCEALRSALPRTDFQMAYGSAVFRQAGYDAADKPMVDFIVAVSDPVEWHRQNLARNPRHYGLLMRTLGASVIAAVQGTAAGVYFHPFVTVDTASVGSGSRPAASSSSTDRSGDVANVKYGVISVAALKQDLGEWSSLYTAGRLHKARAFAAALFLCRCCCCFGVTCLLLCLFDCCSTLLSPFARGRR
jgi:hypothetical protein